MRRVSVAVLATACSLFLAQAVPAQTGMTGTRVALNGIVQQPGRIEAMVLVGATSHFPDQAREVMRATTPGNAPDSELERMRACASRGEAQVRDLTRLFHEMKDSYHDMNFTAPYLSTIEASTLIVHGDRDEFFPVIGSSFPAAGSGSRSGRR